MDQTLLDIFWLVLCSALVFNMQLGFLCLEAGLTRSKNAINVALKNITDFALSVLIYWLYGFGLMFGLSQTGWFGSSLFFPPVGENDAWLSAFFLFQAMFCATSVTIISGATAERLRFSAYILIGALVAGLIYPVFGHWAWAGAFESGTGWLAGFGFVDFAGATVVHSVGGWVALAVLLIIGARDGRFDQEDERRSIPGSNLPMAMLGALLLFFGWFGFNGGSTLAADASVPGIVVNTLLGGVAGSALVVFLNWRSRGFTDAIQPLNGLLAGLVAVTAGAHAFSALDAVVIGAIGGAIMKAGERALIHWRIDDAVGAIPVHLLAGIWGTLAVALLGDTAALGTGLSRGEQLLAQGQGVVACAVWSFGVTYLLLRIVDRWTPLRVDSESERLGLNISEHGTRTELINLLEHMEGDASAGDFHGEVPVEPFTEVGQIARQYNRVVRALSQAVQTTQAIVRDIRDGIITFTAQGDLTSFNPGSQRLFALPPTVSQIRLQQLLDARDWQPSTLFPEPGGEIKREVTCRRWDGSSFLAELTVSREAADSRHVYTGILRDITERRRIEDQLFQEKVLAEVTLSSITDGVITTDSAGVVNYMNPVAEQLTGWAVEIARGKPLSDIYRLQNEQTGAALTDPVSQVLHQPSVPRKYSANSHRALIPREGDAVPVQDAAAPMRDADGGLVGAVLTFSDVSVPRQLAQELRHQASHDPLTGLNNRSEFERQLIQLCASNNDTDRHHVLCYLDLDQFKIVNDTCGHVAGDELLRQLATLFRSRVRDTDVLARLGGDEFGMILYRCDIEKARELAESIRTLVEDFRFAWHDRSFAVGISIGVVPVQSTDDSPTALLSAADAACYAAKEAGRNRVHIYQPDDDALTARHGEMQWLHRIRSALDEDRLRLFVQPVVPVTGQNGQARYEVLVRMLDPDGRIIPPGAFMPAAERYDAATAVDRWVVANTLGWIGDRCRSVGSAPGHFSINLSAASFTDWDFLEFLLTRLASADIPPGLLCFEITETSAIANLSQAVRFMEKIKAVGCELALDDFGTGFSSFGYLKNLPVDYIKIDGSFVKDICNDETARVMVASINSIGQTMGVRTIAEFVETGNILEALKRLGIDYAQGYHLGKPGPLDHLSDVHMMPR